MSTQTRDEMQVIQEQIDTLNYRKAPIQRAFEEERRRDPEAQKPSDLKDFNHQLFLLYDRRDGLLLANPELQKQYGKPGGKKKQAQPSFAFKTKSQLDEKDRSRRKKLIDPDFKAWCAAQTPQIKFSLDNWETDKIRGAFKAEQEAKARAVAEAEAKRQAEDVAAKTKARTERRAKIKAIPKTFRVFLMEMGVLASDGDKLIAAHEDRDNQELFKIWSAERA